MDAMDYGMEGEGSPEMDEYGDEMDQEGMDMMGEEGEYGPVSLIPRFFRTFYKPSSYLSTRKIYRTFSLQNLLIDEQKSLLPSIYAIKVVSIK